MVDGWRRLALITHRSSTGFDWDSSRETIIIAVPKLKICLRIFPAKIAVTGVEINEPKAFWLSSQLFDLFMPGFDELIHSASEPAMANTGTITPKRPNHMAIPSMTLSSGR